MNSALQYSHTPSTRILFARFTILNVRFAMPQVPYRTDPTRLRLIFRMTIRKGGDKAASSGQVAQGVLYASTACFSKVELTTSKV
jgi:hypothetical protein